MITWPVLPDWAASTARGEQLPWTRDQEHTGRMFFLTHTPSCLARCCLLKVTEKLWSLVLLAAQTPFVLFCGAFFPQNKQTFKTYAVEKSSSDESYWVKSCLANLCLKCSYALWNSFFVVVFKSTSCKGEILMIKHCDEGSLKELIAFFWLKLNACNQCLHDRSGM